MITTKAHPSPVTVWTTQDNRAIIQGEIVSDYVRIYECQIVSDYGVRMVYGCGKIWLIW